MLPRAPHRRIVPTSHYERGPSESTLYMRWYGDLLWLFVPIQERINRFLADFDKYPHEASTSLSAGESTTTAWPATRSAGSRSWRGPLALVSMPANPSLDLDPSDAHDEPKRLRHLRHHAAIERCGSMMNFFAAPLSKSLYPCGAWSSEITVALTAFAI